MSDSDDRLFKALADAGRRKLLDRLRAHDGQTLSELCEHLDMTRQGVTQHLALLETANLVAACGPYVSCVGNCECDDGVCIEACGGEETADCKTAGAAVRRAWLGTS